VRWRSSSSRVSTSIQTAANRTVMAPFRAHPNLKFQRDGWPVVMEAAKSWPALGEQCQAARNCSFKLREMLIERFGHTCESATKQ